MLRAMMSVLFSTSPTSVLFPKSAPLPVTSEGLPLTSGGPGLTSGELPVSETAEIMSMALTLLCCGRRLAMSSGEDTARRSLKTPIFQAAVAVVVRACVSV